MTNLKWMLSVFALVPSLALSAQLLVLNKGDATLSFVEPEAGKIETTIATGEGPHEIELSTDLKFAYVSNYGANADGNTLSIVDVAARKEVARIDLGELKRPHGLSYTRDGLYFSSEKSRKVGRLNAQSRTVDWTIPTDQDGTHMVLASRDGAMLFTTNMGSNTVSFIERGGDNRWVQTLIPVGQGPEALDLSPDGREFWAAHSRDGNVSIIDVASKKVVQTVTVNTKRSNRLKFTPNGRWVLISDLGAGELVVLDARTRTQRSRMPLGRAPTGILIPSNEHAYVALSGENKIAVIDLKTLTVAKTIATGASPDGMAWVP